MWFQLAVFIVSTLLTFALRPKQEDPPHSTLDDISIPTNTQGTPVPVVFGDVWIESWMVLWYGDMNVQPIKNGGKK